MVQFSSDDESATEANGLPSGAGGCGVSDGGRVFTVDSANRLLPLVARIAADLVALAQSLALEAEQIRGIERLPRKSDIRSYTEELDCVKEAFRVESARLDEVRNELAELGVEVDSVEAGAFDFPAFRDRRPIRLCWKLGELEVGHWHGVGETFLNRRPISDM
jgi:hypothetical protein